MKTVKQISALTGVSVRTLHHYDSIGLLKPTATTEAGYRLYDDDALHRLQQILLYRELGFPLKLSKGCEAYCRVQVGNQGFLKRIHRGVRPPIML